MMVTPPDPGNCQTQLLPKLRNPQLIPANPIRSVPAQPFAAWAVPTGARPLLTDVNQINCGKNHSSTVILTVPANRSKQIFLFENAAALQSTVGDAVAADWKGILRCSTASPATAGGAVGLKTRISV
jgi:hypothetical protein